MSKSRFNVFHFRTCIVDSPLPLVPPFLFDPSIDVFYEQEVRDVMQSLDGTAYQPLETPTIDLFFSLDVVMCRTTLSLADLEKLPVAVLATLVMQNLFNQPRVLLRMTC